MKIKTSPFLLPLLTLALVLFIYWPVLSAPKVIDHDYGIVIRPLENIQHFDQYIEKLKTNQILDLQPLRDLSIWGALQVQSHFKITNFLIYYNLVLWLLSLWIIYNILNKLKFTQVESSLVTLLLAAHPILTQIVPWMSAHKHLLAFFWGVASLKYYIYLLEEEAFKKGYIFFVIVFYLFSVLSHPIALILPLVFSALLLTKNSFLIYFKKNRQILCVLFATLFIIMMTTALINLCYYSGPYTLATSNSKFSDTDLTERLLAFGRSFIQIVYPASFARYYYIGSISNLIGLLILPLCLYMSGKIIGWKTTLSYSCLFFFPLVLLNIKPTNIFISDSYLLFPVLGVIILCLNLISKMLKRFPVQKPIILFIISCLVLTFTFKSRSEARQWTDALLFTQKSYEREKDCINLISYSTQLWRMPERRVEANKVTKELILRGCQISPSHSVFYAEAQNAIIANIYFSEDFQAEQKILLLRQTKNPYAKLFEISLLIDLKQEEEADEIFEELISLNMFAFFNPAEDPALKELTERCQKNESAICKKHKAYLKHLSQTPKI